MTDDLTRDDLTLAEMRAALASEVAANAAFDGWSDAARDLAADALGLDRDVAALAMDGGAPAMIDAWFAHVDAAMLAQFPPERIATLRIRERIAALVETRLDLLSPDREALRRALSILAMPQHLGLAARLGWRTADTIWRAAGDTATDYNHYTKRAILGGVYAATIAVFLNDDSEGVADTRAFLARRIESIMRFEKAKAQFLSRSNYRPSLTRFVSRLRYPAV